jgi:SsrA-binding protein
MERKMPGNNEASEPKIRVVANNRKAHHLYHIDQTWEAGLVLYGTEAKSLRCGGGSLVDSYGEAAGGEIFLNNIHIAPYEKGNRFNVETRRRRKILLNKREIRKIVGAIAQKGFTLIPLRIYFRGQWAKIEVALARGKKDFDKRHDLKDREGQREMERAWKDHER